MAPMVNTAPPKSWVVTLLLVLFFGSLGAHNFYLGYRNRGIAQLALTVIGWFSAVLIIGFVLLAVVGVWVLVDLIRILLRSGEYGVDANGVPLS